MRAHIFSDLHLEQSDPWTPNEECDIYLIAGDVHNGVETVKWLNALKAPVVYVLGNHDYYHGDLEKTLSQMKESAEEHVHILENESVEIGGINFLGCTLWTDYKLYWDILDVPAEFVANKYMMDFHLIKKNGDKVYTTDFKNRHLESVDWLKNELAKEGRKVVITHHLPSEESVAPIFVKDNLTPAFASDLNWMIEQYNIELWVHGHTHASCSYKLHDTHVICNPRGYRRESYAFDEQLVVEL